MSYADLAMDFMAVCALISGIMILAALTGRGLAAFHNWLGRRHRRRRDQLLRRNFKND